MPLTEINVTNPPPVYANYWTDREAARAAAPVAGAREGRGQAAAGRAAVQARQSELTAAIRCRPQGHA